MTRLLDLKAPRARFARSVNVERDAGSTAIDGYLPVGRAIDVIGRLAAVLDRDDVEAALSVTGPYGTGKSSLAVVIDALLGPARDRARRSAEELLGHTAPDVLAVLAAARKRLGAHEHGFIRAVVTAQREPIAATVVRALVHGAERYKPAANDKAAHTKVLARLRRMAAADSRPEAREIRHVVADLGRVAPVLLLVDEFGKNLEAFADSHSDADLFLLQELAEWTRGASQLPLAVVTLQHMAFDEYAGGAGSSQRREWAKIQGRFEDVPFVDSPAQTRALIAAAFDEPSPAFARTLEQWGRRESEKLARLGIDELAADPALLARCWPLHPLALGVLPELCERYGQNERSLFSFLAGHEPGTVAGFLAETSWDGTGDPPVVPMHRVYDYFLDSAASLVGVSTAASRWVEVDTRIRDTHGIDAASRRVLKSVGLLNLVSAGGALRASRAVLCYAATDGERGTTTAEAVAGKLARLEEAGVLTFRDFADEYRIWQGSDFDLRAAIDGARRRLHDETPSKIVTSVLPLEPLVAARHSHHTGTLRAFARGWVDSGVASIEPLGTRDRADGSALYVLGDTAPTDAISVRAEAKPVAFLTTAEPDRLIDAAREVAAIDDVLASSDDLDDDWVARRELLERRFEAMSVVQREFEAAYGAASAVRGEWLYAKPGPRRRWVAARSASASAALSEVADAWYHQAPVVRNDLVNRHDLSSQAAKARRVLVEAMLARPDHEGLGIEGFGPDRTMYLSVLRELGLHRRTKAGWGFGEPPTEQAVRPAWDRLVALLRDATDARVNVADVFEQLAAPPYGVRAGVAPILLVAALVVHGQEVGLYEHGTFRPVLTADTCERLCRNPGNFEVKYFAARRGARAAFLAAVAERLGVAGREQAGSVLVVLSHVVALVNALPEYVKRTTHLSADALAVRRALFTATEPDQLLFRAVPEALGFRAVGVGGRDAAAVHELADRFVAVVEELRTAYPRLLADIRGALHEELRGPAKGLRESLTGRAREIDGRVIDPRLAKLVVGLTAPIPGDDEWVEYVAMNVAGVAPAAWTDDDRERFFGLLHDIGSTFRRVEALNADLRSRGEGFDVVRVTVTRPDGAEAARLVWIDESRRAALAPVLQQALQQARRRTGSEADARDSLLALLAELEMAVSSAASIDTRGPSPTVITETAEGGA